jgi:hypothetical protein
MENWFDGGRKIKRQLGLQNKRPSRDRRCTQSEVRVAVEVTGETGVHVELDPSGDERDTVGIRASWDPLRVSDVPPLNHTQVCEKTAKIVKVGTNFSRQNEVVSDIPEGTTLAMPFCQPPDETPVDTRV